MPELSIIASKKEGKKGKKCREHYANNMKRYANRNVNKRSNLFQVR